MRLSRIEVPEQIRNDYKNHCYKVINCIQQVHNHLGPAMPEYVYQEALCLKLRKEGFEVCREYQHHPVFEDVVLSSFVRMDLVVKHPDGNIIIECKSIAGIGDREQIQTFGYLCATRFPFAILANFGTYPKAQIERYHFDAIHDTICAF